MRIAVVNDSPAAVNAIENIVGSVPKYEIAWTAGNGAEAVKGCKADRPDLILMNLVMPVMDGAEATRLIMKNTPCSILVVTSTVEGNRSKVFEAMGHGALDVVTTPDLGPRGETEGAEELLDKIAVIGKLIGKAAETRRRTPGKKKKLAAVIHDIPPLVIIGSSTGGPKALSEILSELPEKFGAAVAIIQHVNAEYTAGMAEWLGQQCPLPVALAVDGAYLEAGKVLLAATDDHLIIKPDLTLKYTSEPREYNYRPSVDIFFRSIEKNWPECAAAVLLTGMGSDGARGLLALRKAGWYTIAQDKKSSIVYGMPKAAAELGAAVDILPVDRIVPALVSFFDKA
ncbi:MAG: chemotaxis response regulator protein-glutamate methylesterase [Gemmatimonadota bacterium]|nr:chemotaxis response regulator protein-glutamate methylesterase [Gemmatimonadota bacterium]